MKTYPAIDVATDAPDLLAALVDDYSPVAIETRDAAVRVFFATPVDRDAAQHALAPSLGVAPVDVPDEDWARRSQEDLREITVGRITVWPTADGADSAREDLIADPRSSPLSIVIRPSMGFGTGHHATTRLCLEALQTIDLAGRAVLDVGTGSGILAIAAVRLGAARALGIDPDDDAIQSARENLALNGAGASVAFAVADAAAARLPRADVVTANLTGALLVRVARQLIDLARDGGVLILSGLLASERDVVAAAYTPRGEIVWEREEDGWIGLAVKRSWQVNRTGAGHV